MDYGFLSEERSLPAGHGEDRIVQWHVFRAEAEARKFAEAVRLGEGQRLVGGTTRDSLGALTWVGVEVDDLERWGHHDAVNKRGASA